MARASDHAALDVVSPSAADAVTVLVFVTLPTGRPRGEPAGQAKARRVVKINQICSPGDLVAVTQDGFFRWREVSFPRGLVGGAHHLEGHLVFLLELLANLVERRELPPTRPDGARAGDPVAFTSGLHSSFDDLQRKEGDRISERQARAKTPQHKTLAITDTPRSIAAVDPKMAAKSRTVHKAGPLNFMTFFFCCGHNMSHHVL